jgi:hypothetical protein
MNSTANVEDPQIIMLKPCLARKEKLFPVSGHSSAV